MTGTESGLAILKVDEAGSVRRLPEKLSFLSASQRAHVRRNDLRSIRSLHDYTLYEYLARRGSFVHLDIELSIFEGRSVDAKKQLIRLLFERVHRECGIHRRT